MKAIEKIVLVIAICLVILIFIAGIFALAQSTGFLPNTSAGTISTSSQNLERFTQLEVQANVNLEIIKADNYAIKLSQPKDGSRSTIQTKVVDSKLTIVSNDEPFQAIIPLKKPRMTKVTVYTPGLTAIKLFSAGAIYGEDMTGDDVYVEINGSGTIELNNIKVGTIRSAIYGSGSIIISGNVDQHSAQIVGSGDIIAPNLIATSGSADITGSGDITMYVTKSLDASIEGSGQIDFYGNPVLTQKISGSGSIDRLSN